MTDVLAVEASTAVPARWRQAPAARSWGPCRSGWLEESTAYVVLPTAVPPGTKEVSLVVKAKTGYASSDPATLPVQGP
jgi:hypothetical protein